MRLINRFIERLVGWFLNIFIQIKKFYNLKNLYLCLIPLLDFDEEGTPEDFFDIEEFDTLVFFSDDTDIFILMLLWLVIIGIGVTEAEERKRERAASAGENENKDEKKDEKPS